MLFQLDIALKEAGGDTAKRAAVVNQVAETISRINKIGRFYQTARLYPPIGGLAENRRERFNALVNKYIRERIGKTERLPAQQQPPPDMGPAVEYAPPSDLSEESFNLLHQDALQEQAIVRVLLEYGLKSFDAKKNSG